jgi:hypothetical protein
VELALLHLGRYLKSNFPLLEISIHPPGNVNPHFDEYYTASVTFQVGNKSCYFLSFKYFFEKCKFF